MTKYRHTYFFLLLFALLTAGITSCSYKHYKGFEPAASKNMHLPVIYDTAFNKAVYTTELKVLGRELSGLTIVKRTPGDSTFHVVFMSQIGLKFFDVEIRNNDQKDWFRVNYMMESLNKDFLVNILKTDFMLLFSHYPENHSTAVFHAQGGKEREITVRFDKYVSSLFSDSNDNVTGIVFRKGRSVKTTIHITPGNNYPESVDINNKTAGLQLSWDEIQM